MKHLANFVVAACLFVGSSIANAFENNYLVGVGKADITGSAAEVVMLGYANPDQKSSGIHTRQFARAFIIADPETAKRIVFVNADVGLLFQSIKQEVSSQLAQEFQGLYGTENVIISATHTHAGPSGQSHYTLYNASGAGHAKENFDVLVEGIVDAVAQAHSDLAPGSALINQANLDGVVANRSMPAFLKNPGEITKLYPDGIDSLMTSLWLEQSGKTIGLLNWFPVHGVSMSMFNTLLSGDNKGYAEYLFEKEMGDDFVAAFAQGNSGDLTPNVWLNGRGPTEDEFENTRLVGFWQYQKAMQMFYETKDQLSGAIDYRHAHKNMSMQTISSKFTGSEDQQTCVAALGPAFAAGTEDGRPVEIWHEGQTKAGLLTKLASTILFFPTEEDRACHQPKPILIATGKGFPYPWTPEVLPIALHRIGQFGIIAMPGEVTVVSGHRLRATAEKYMPDLKYTTIAALSNAYSGYITTNEEYSSQQYEGGSTHFGPWTLAAYRQVLAELAQDMSQQQLTAAGPEPRDLSDKQIINITGVIWDNVPLGKRFGQQRDTKDFPRNYRRGETVVAEFFTGHPRNDFRNEDSYLQVQQRKGFRWVTIATDNDWETKYHWKRLSWFWGTSKATIEWTIPNEQAKGTYRIVHKGDRKRPFSGKIVSFEGKSKTFKVK
ncbi:neutral/alkaline ceramidase [Pelagibaculum spongiae]|uniref:Neutral ceramidase n=1 Tax=Pelagibaculum spongiae TaxID=2080658 RepID=A0A2V1GYB3_9GAMM|nr:neutral/alkaline ceramidase [Pelagibaculum spongiae]PVZ67725.1 alkaline ceramidase [Pelagibaculum spongiae]